MNDQSTTPNPPSSAHVSRVVVSRLFSMGQYEHQRVEVTVEIPAGARPGQIVGQLTKAIEQLKRRTSDQEDLLEQCLERLADPENASLDTYTPDLDYAKGVVAAANAADAGREAALREIDQIGGVIS